jgi:hypothetical protein
VLSGGGTDFRYIITMSLFSVPRNLRTLGVLAVVASLLSLGSASAATLSLFGTGTPGNLPATFNPSGLAAMNLDGIGVGTDITIFSGTTNTGGLFLSSNAYVTFTFMGAESRYTTQLLVGNSVLFDNNGTPGTPSVTITAGAGLLPFLFSVTKLGNPDAVNGGSIATGLQIAFAKVSDTTFYAFLDAGGDRTRYSDFDNMVVKIEDPIITPLPGTLSLFASGLGALGLLGWRRKRKVI